MTARRLLNLKSPLIGPFSRRFFAALFLLTISYDALAVSDSTESLAALSKFFQAQGVEPLEALSPTLGGPSAADAAQTAKDELAEPVERAYPSTADFDSLTRAIESIEGLSKQDADTMASEIRDLFSTLVEFGRAQEIKLGSSEFKKALLLNEIAQNDETGRAELNLVDGVKFQRVIHQDSEVSFAFIPVEKVPENSKHEARIIASQHLTAGKSRTDGQTGRDTVNIYYRWKDGEPEIVNVRYFQRHARWTRAWWRDQILISLYAPSLPDIFVSGLFWGGVQAGQSYLLNPEVNRQMIFTGCFGAVCGVFATSLRKFNQIGGRLENLVRNSITTTIPFLIPFAMMDPHRNFDHWSKVALFVGVEIPVFCFFGNISKTPLQLMVKDISDKGLIREKTIAGVKTGNWLYQGMYNFIIFPIRLLFLKAKGGLQLKDSLGFNLGWQKLALPLLYPLFWQARVALAEKLGVEGSKERRIKFERSTVGASTGLLFGSLHDIPAIPLWAIERLAFGEITQSPDEYIPWLRLKARWSLQIHSPFFHLGRMVEALGNLITVRPAEDLPAPSPRFSRVKPTEFPPEEPALLTTSWRKLGTITINSFRATKLAIDKISIGSLTRCQTTLETLGRRMQAPFLKRLENFELPSFNAISN